MRSVSLILAILFSVVSVFASDIREFSVPTLERLGTELYRRDQITGRSSDILRQTEPLASSLKLGGWITDLHKNGDVVYWIAEMPSGPVLAYTVTFHGSDKPEVQDVRGQPLPPKIALRYKARTTAIQALQKRLFKIPYNFEVLSDPDGSGFLVYALGTTGKQREAVIGGNFRVTVSADGEKVERVDALSRTLMITDPSNSGLPKGTHRTGSFMNQIVSNKPVETLIYASRILNQPIFVGTPDGKVWQVANGKMSIDNSKPGSDTQGAAAHKAFQKYGR